MSSWGTARLSIIHRHYLASHHIWSAAHFTRAAFKLEATTGPAPPVEVHLEHRAYVIGAVLTSVAFLEAVINQIFEEAHDANMTRYLDGLKPADIEALGKARAGGAVPRNGDRSKILNKYDWALAVIGKPRLPVNGPPYEDVAALIELRNALTHFEPESVISDRDRTPRHPPHPLEGLLKGRFATNPLPGNTFFPDKALGHGCAEWATQKSLAFADAAHKALGLTNPIYDGVRAQLLTR